MLKEFEKQMKDTDTQRFHFMQAGVLLEEPQPINWLIKDRLEAGSLSLIFGEPGSMKTFIKLDEGLCISSGKNWHGHKITKGAVFYIAGEGLNGLSRRIRAWEIHNDISTKDIPFFISDRPAQFLDPISADAVVAAVDEMREIHGDPVLVIIDTLNRNFGPGDENSTKDMTQFIAIIDEKLRTRYSCAVSIIHHSGLSTGDRARGASALKAALDWEYKIQKNTDKTLTMTNTKCKDFEAPAPMTFRVELVTLAGWVDADTGQELTSVVLVPTERITHSKPLSGAKKIAFESLLRAIEESGSSPVSASNGANVVHIDVWRADAYRNGISPQDTKAKKMAFYRAVKTLQADSLVSTMDDYYWPSNDTN